MIFSDRTKAHTSARGREHVCQSAIREDASVQHHLAGAKPQVCATEFQTTGVMAAWQRYARLPFACVI